MSRLLLFLEMMWLPLGLLIVGFTSGIKTETYKAGGKAVLSPGSVNGPITSITWKHGADIAVERFGQEVHSYRDFTGRCELDTTTGALTISNLMLKDSGSYTAEINYRVMKPTEIKVITAVPKPTVSTHCNPEGTECTLTCDANIPETTGSVTYSWMIGDAEKPSATKQLNITKDDTESLGKLISCQLENPVSRERSDDITSPLTNGRSVGGIIAAVVIVLAIILGLLVHYLIWRRKNDNAGCHQYLRMHIRCIRNRLNREGGAPLDQEQRNGAGTPQGTAEEAALLAPTQNGGAPDLSVQETSYSTVVPTFHSPNTVTFSLDNETHNRDPNLRNKTAETLSVVPDTPAQDPTPVEPPETAGEPEVPETTSGVQEELEGD